LTAPASDLWVFGYGSLMWRPGFVFRQALPATLDGYHRSFCVLSRYWRGTPQCPGLVLGLMPGGCCHGLAFQVAAADAAAVTTYLNQRELGPYAYVPRHLPVMVAGCRRTAYTFVADETHIHYAGDLPTEQAARIIMDAEGVAGLNRDYLINTVRELEAQGFVEPALHDLLRTVERLTGIIESGAGI
jgi:cation transport protein ChaC